MITKLKVLLIDDDPIFHFINSKVLKRLGLTEISTAQNGQEALTLIKTCKEQYSGHGAIFVDLDMPILNGFGFIEAYKKLNFENEKETLVKDLPLGWKQKLSFSVSIFHNPKVVFLDEPTGGVDPVTRRQFWELIYEATAKGITVFVTTHYMDEAEYCNRVSIMVDGRIDALDNPNQLKHTHGVKTMDEVFLKLARKAVRSE